MNRLSQDEYFMRIARVASLRGNCYRRQVGCVLVNEHNEILATGYGGVPRGVPHCTPETCPRANSPSGSKMIDICPAVHAEMNAMIQCRDIWAIKTAYVTTQPCLTCTAMLMNTGCIGIIFDEDYGLNNDAAKLWLSDKKRWMKRYALSKAVV